MNDKVSDEASRASRMDMTPMIDVTFQLIIFFMCAIKFKVLEGKLQTYLPKDAGVNHAQVDRLLEDVDVRIERRADRGSLDLDDPGVYRAWTAAGGSGMDQIDVYLHGTKVRDFAALQSALRALRAAIPEPADANDRDPLRLKIDAARGVIYEDVVRVVDAALGARISEVTFRGIELDA